jgi:phosphatidylserine decarboxylase
MTLARWGIPTVCWTTLALGWLVALLFGHWTFWVALGLAVPLELFVVAFFRNPRRSYAGPDTDLLAPSDGVVADIGEVAEAEYIGGPAVRIGIFMSVFDVHVNRAPAAGVIRYAAYRPGRFLDARHPDADHANESNTLGMELTAGVPGTRVLVKQISGLIARRIVCTHGVDDALERGGVFGMIRFGSRTELWIPRDVAHAVRVQVGDKVRCGETVLVALGDGAGPAKEGDDDA